MFGRTIILLVVALVNIILFIRMIWGPTGLIEYHKLKNEYNNIEQQIAGLDSENLILSREIRLLQTDSSYMEKMIHQRLHYVHDNEVIYLFGDADKQGQNHDGKN